MRQQKPKLKTKQEAEKEHAEELLDRNLLIVRKIEHYQTSQWRRLKFWYQRKWKENPVWCRVIHAVITGLIIGLAVGLVFWILRLNGVDV